MESRERERKRMEKIRVRLEQLAEVRKAVWMLHRLTGTDHSE